MRNSVKISAAALSAAALVSLSALGAAAVGEASLPAEDDRLMVLTCDDLFPYSVGEVDTMTGIVTPIGEQIAEGEGECWSQGLYNPADGQIYSVDWNHGTDGFALLRSIDPATGEDTVVGPITDLRTDLGVNQYSLAITADGDVFAASDSELFSLDLATGDATFIGHFNDGDDVNPSFYSFAVNPVDGVLYGVSWIGQDVYAIDTTDATLTLVDSSWNDGNGDSTAGLIFDSNGLGWFQHDGLPGFFVADITNLAATRSASIEFLYNDVNFYAESLVIVPGAIAEEEALAETGVDYSLYGTAAIALVLAATGIVVARLRRR